MEIVDKDWEEQINANIEKLAETMKKKVTERPSANWRDIGDVEWADLDYFIAQCKITRNRDSFDTALRILETLKKQILER